MLSVSPAVRTAVSGGLTHLGRRPLVLLTIACLLGIIWADWAVPPLLALGMLCLLVIALAAFCLHRDLPATNVFLLLGMFLIGALLHTWRITPGPADLGAEPVWNLPLVEGTVVGIEQQWEAGQDVVVADLTADGRPLTRRAALRLPATPVVRLAQRVTLAGVSLRRPDRQGSAWARSQIRHGIHAGGNAKQIAQLAQRPSAARTAYEAAAGLRGRMLDTLQAAMRGPDPDLYARLLAGMVYGMQAAPLPSPIKELFRRTGTIHLLVVSGAQVSLIGFALIFLVRGRRLVLPGWGMALVALALLALALVSGMGISVQRSVAMALVLLGSFAWGRRYDFPTALAVAALALSLLDTGIVFDLGPQLTFACCLGAYLAAPQSAPGERPRQPWAFLSFVCWATLGAWLFASPLLIATFSRLVLLAGLANLVAVPLSVGLLYVGLAAIALGMIWLPLAVPLCGLARLMLEAVLRVNIFCDTLPLAGVDYLHLQNSQLILWYALVIGCFWVLRSKTPWELARGLNWRRVGVGAGAVLCGGVLLVSLSARSSHSLRVDVLDVGAGQCVLARAPGGVNVLLDAGTEPRGDETARPASRTVLPFLALQGVRSLEAIVLSHPHEDHCNLAAEVMQALPTRRLIVGPDAGAEASWPAILQAARTRGVEVVSAQAGGTLRLGSECALEFLEPRTMLSGTADDANNNSLVERLVYRQVQVLLPADLQAEGEARLVRDYRTDPAAIRAQVLIAAHHASVYSGTPDFLRAVAPEVVVVSCGTGRRRPRPEALSVFEDLGLPVWRTDLSGTVQLTTDGRKVKVRGYRK